MNNLKIAFYCIVIILCVSCKKFLDKKPEMSLYVPERWEDLQALLDNVNSMNFGPALALPELIGGDIYIADNVWNSATIREKNHYIWSPDAKNDDGWLMPYATHIFVSNVVIDNIDKVTNRNETNSVNIVKGSALFFRSLGFYNLAQLYCQPYNSKSADKDLGLVLKLNGDVAESKVRSSNTDVYSQIISDLKKSIELLPLKSSSKFRPSKLAAQALLTRVYLSMSDYVNAEIFADAVLSTEKSLLDYNNLLPVNNPRIPLLAENPEVIFFYRYQNTNLTSQSNARIDPFLYNSYEVADLRKILFFQPNTGSAMGSYRFKGSYYGEIPSSIFNGLAINEIYFIKMECLARRSYHKEAITLLNDFLKKRYVVGQAKTYTVSGSQEDLQTILAERRKELVYRGLRWTDIRRLNLEGANILLERRVDGKSYELQPNDLRYALLIPDEEVIRFGIQQNPRK